MGTCVKEITHVDDVQWNACYIILMDKFSVTLP